MRRPLSAADVITLLGLEPHMEGGHFTETFRDTASTAIYYLLAAPDFSTLHRLPGPEVFHHYAGVPVHMLLLHADGGIAEPTLGSDLVKGQRPQVVVPGGTWQGCAPAVAHEGAWALLGTTMAPGFRYEDFEVGGREDLTAAWPAAAARIAALTRG